MDFNQILLFAGLGLLVLIVLFALWGFLGGLKRELKCIAVFIVLLVLFWLVFGDEATLMNAKFGQNVASILKIQNDSISTVWDAVLAFAKAKIPNGETLLVEGKETYALFYSLAATIFRAVGLIAGTLAVLIICPIIRLISHIVWLIIRACKKRSAKKSVALEEQLEDAPQEKGVEQVVIPSNQTSADEAVLTKEENELPKKPVGKRRWWGALAGALKGVFVVILVFVPVSGLCTILNTATPETKAMVSELVSGKKEEKTANNANMIESVFDFAEAYDNSAIGKFVESSSYFFGKSFSQSLFDNLLRIETKNQIVGLNDELITIVKAANELNGKSKLGSWSDNEVKKLTDQLKNSKLLVEVMPVAIEYSYEIKNLNKMIASANQGTNFLELRYNNWKNDVLVVLDVVAEAYKLDIFPLDEFNYLTMNADQVEEVVKKLCQANFIAKVMPILVNIGVNLEVVKNNVGTVNTSGVEAINWSKELKALAEVYRVFQKLEITEIKDIDFNSLVGEILNDENKKQVALDLADDVLGLQLAEKFVVPVGINFAAKQETVKKLLNESNQLQEFLALQNVVTINDLKIIVRAAGSLIELFDFKNYPPVTFDYFNFDVEVLRDAIGQLINVTSLNNIIDVAANIGIRLEKVQEFIGNSLDHVDFTKIDWKSDLLSLTDVYDAFLELEFVSLDEIKNSKWNVLLTDIIDDDEKFTAVQTILEKIVSLDLYTKAGTTAANYIINKIIDEKVSEFSGIVELTGLTKEQWKEDLFALLDVAKAAKEIKAFENVEKFDYKNLDLTSTKAIENFRKIVDNILSLNLIHDDETKNKLLIASIRQFKWLENVDNIDLGNINWENEKETIIKLIDSYEKIVNLEGIDINDIEKINWQELLESDLFVDYVVEALDNLVDSNLILELLPEVINKYVLPKIEQLEQIDDDTLVRDIFNKVNSEELVEEVIKLIDVVKASLDLGLLEVKDGGIDKIDFANTEAMKDIVSGILDCKLVEGNEGRIIRIILKATGVLDIQKDSDVYKELIELDYTGEKVIILDFIDKITPALKDENFSLTDENGKFKLDLKFWAENEHAKVILEGVKALFGSYEENTVGSQLITALLPSIYDKFVEGKNLIPDDFKDIVDELGVTDANGKLLAHDISCLVYVLEQLVSINAQSYLDKGNVEINENTAIVLNNIIDALHDIELIYGHENATLAWGVNYLAKMLKIDIEAVNADFDNVDWQGQKELYKEVINDLVALAIKNNIGDVEQLVNVVKEIIKGKSSYVTDENANDLLNILDKIADVQVVDAVLPLAIKYVVKILDGKDISVEYLNSFTNEQLAEDFHKLVDIAHIAVEEGNFVYYYQGGFDKELELPNREVVKKIIHEALQLHILSDADGKLLEELYSKLVYKNLTNASSKSPLIDSLLDALAVEQFKFSTINWDTEEAIVIALVDAAFDLIDSVNLNTISEVLDFINNKDFLKKNFATDENGYIATELLRKLTDSQIVSNVIVQVYEGLIDFVEENAKDFPFSLSKLKGQLTSKQLMDTLTPVADILDIAIEAGALEYVRTNDIAIINLDLIADIVEKLSTVPLIINSAPTLAVEGLNYLAKVLNEKLNANITINEEDVKAIDFTHEFSVLAQTVRSLDGVLEVNKLVSVKDVIDFIKKSSYKKYTFINESLTPVITNIADLDMLKVILPELLDMAVDKVKEIDLSFMKNTFTGEELAADIKVLANTIGDAVDAEFVKMAAVIINILQTNISDNKLKQEIIKHELEPFNIHLTEYANIINIISSTNILNRKYPELISELVNFAFKKVKLDQTVTPELFIGITFEQEAKILVNAVLSLQPVLDNAKLVKIGDVLETIEDKKFYENERYANENVVYPLIDVIDLLVELDTLQVLLPTATEVITELTDKKQLNLGFLFEDLTQEELVEDVKLLLEYARDVVKLGGLEYLTTKNIAEFDSILLSEMVEGLYGFNILKKHSAQGVLRLIDIINNKFKDVRLNVTLEELETINYEQEYATIASVVALIDQFMDTQVSKSLNDLIDIVKKQSYNNKAFFNRDTFDVLLAMANKATELQTLELVLPHLIKYGVRLANAERINISFILDDLYTTEYQIEDLRTLINALDKAYDCGIIDYIFDKDIPEINDVAINNVLNELINLHVLDLFFHDFLALGVNKGFKAIKFDIIVTKEDFVNVVLANEIYTLQSVVTEIKALMEVKGLKSLSDLNNVIVNKDYNNKDFYDVATGEVIANALSKLVDLETVVAILPYVFNEAINKIKVIDLSYLKNNFTNEELASDLKQLTKAIVPATRAELVGLLFKEDAKELNLHFTEYGEILEAVKDLNVLNKKYPELASELINFALTKLSSKQSVTPELFVGITFSEEVPALVAALNQFDAVAKNAEFVKVKDIIEVTKDKKFYENEKYANENVVYPLIDTLIELTDLRTLEAAMQVLSQVIVEFADKGGINVNFLFKDVTNEQLISDAKLLLEYAKDAVKLGGLEYLTTKDIANFDATILAQMVEGLYDFNILHGNMAEILDIAFAYINTKIKGIEFDIDYRDLDAIDYANEFAVLALVIAEVKPFMEGLEYTSLNSLLNVIKNKDYQYKNFFNEVSYDAMVKAVYNAADSQILGLMLPDLLDFAIRTAYDKGYDIQFLKDKVYTTEFKLEDIRTVANILDKAYDFGLVDYIFDKDIVGINEIIANEILEEVGKLHALELFLPDVLALGINKAMQAVKLDIKVVRDDFVGIVLTDEVHALQDVVIELKALLVEKGLDSILDVKEFITNKEYNKSQFYNEPTAQILASVLTELADSDIFAVLLPYFLDYGIDKFTKVNLSFLKGNFDKEELRSDVKNLANAIVPAIKAGLINLTTLVEEEARIKYDQLVLHFEEYKEILVAIQDLNVINKMWPQLASTITNEVLKMLKSDDRVSENEFAGLTLSQDVPYLLKAIDELNIACQNASFTIIKDLLNVKDIANTKFVEEEVAYPLVNAVEQLVQMANLEAFLPTALNHLAQYLKQSKKIDLLFLLEELTKEELVADARLLVTYARDAIKLGGLEYIKTKDIAKFDSLLASDMVEGLYGFNMIQKHAPEIMVKVIELLNSKLKNLQINITLEELETVDYQNELFVASEILDMFDSFMKAEICNSLKDIIDIVKEKLYNSKAFYNEDAVNTMLSMIAKATDLKLLELALPDLVDYLVKFADSKKIDISFIKNELYTTDYQLEDIKTLTVILEKAYDFGVIDYIFDKEIVEISDIILNEILEEAINLHVLDLFLPDILALGINKGFEALKIDINVVRDDFTSVVLADDFHALQDVVVALKSLMNEKGLKSLLDITDLIKSKGYNNRAFFDETTGSIIADILNELADVETVAILLPKLLDYATVKVNVLDLSVLKGVFDKEELRSDVRSLANAIVPGIKAGAVELIYKQDIKELPLEFVALKEMLNAIKDMNVLNKVWPQLASTLSNELLAKLNSIQLVTPADFEGLTFSEDVPTIITALDNLEEVLAKVNVNTINGALEIFKNKDYKDQTIANRDVANTLLIAIEKMVDAKNVQVLLPVMLRHTVEYLTIKGTVVDYLFGYADNNEIIQDIYTIIATAHELVDYGMIEFVLFDGEIDVNDFTVLNRAFENIMNLHIIKGNQPNVIVTVLEKLKVETENIDLFDVNWNLEIENIETILELTRQLLSKFELNTISKIKGFEYKKLITINDEFNGLLDIYSQLLKAIGEDQVISLIILPISEKYLENVKYKELISLHNIYNTSSEFQSDLLSLAMVVEAIRDLDLNGFLREGKEYPFHEEKLIELIIREVFDLYYLNNENRLDQIIKFIDTKVTADLSNVSAEGIDLRSDTDKFIDIYKHFVNITESQFWTLNKNNDKFDIRLLGSTYVLDQMIAILETYIDTTVYDKTGFAILLLGLPLVGKIAPNYYHALELDKVTVSMLEHDAKYLENIINTLITIDITDVVTNGSYFTSDIHNAISSILDDLYELEVFKGHANAFLTELVNDLVNGKEVYGVVVPEETITFITTSLRNDRLHLNELLDELYALCARENITTVSELKSFVKGLTTKSGLKEFLSKDASWTMMENVAKAFAEMTFVKENALAIVNSIVTPVLEQKGSKFAKYLDLTAYDNETFINEIITVRNLISSMNELGAAGIIRGEEIAYEKVEVIQNIFQELSEIKYVEYHMDQIINFVSRRLPFSIQGLHSDEFTYALDMMNLSEAYTHLVPYLTSSNNPYKTIYDIKNGFKVTKELLISTIDYLYDFADAYDCLVKVSALALVAPELFEYIKPSLPNRLQGLANVVSFEGQTFVQTQNDLLISSELLRNLIDFGIVNVLDDKDVIFSGMVKSTVLDQEVTRAEMINMIIENVRNMGCLADRSGLLLEVLVIMNIDTTTIDLSGVDWEVEFDNLESLVIKGIAVLEDYDLHTLKEIINYIKSINRNNIKAEIKRLVRLVKADIEDINNIMETLDNSEAFNQLFKPLYNKYVLRFMPVELGDLSEYTTLDLDEDMTRLANITRALLEMKKVPGSVKENATSSECIIPTQTIIEEFFSLNLLDQKKQAIVNLINRMITQIDFSDLDVTGVDLVSDGKVIAQYAEQILIIYKNMNGYRITTADLANTEMMDAFITIYNGCVDTDSVQIIANWVYNKYIASIVESRNWTSKFDTTEETVSQITKEVGNILEAFLDMGVFSNNGIDFTNANITDRLFGIFENVYQFSEKKMVLVNMLKANLDIIGVVPFTYENMYMKNELRIARDVLRSLRTLLREHKDEFSNNPIKALNNLTVQNKLDSIIERLFDSKISNQLLLPVLDGMVKIYTRDIYEITILEGMTPEEFKNTFVANLYELIEKAVKLGLADKKLGYNDTKTITEVLDILVYNAPFNSHLEEIMKYVLYIYGADVRDEYFGNINWEVEYIGLRQALEIMTNAMKNVNIHDISTMKNNEFISALAEAMPTLNDSKVLPLVIRPLIEVLLNKLGKQDRFDYYINCLYNSSYTNELLMKDYALLPEILMAVVDLGYFDGGINYQELDPIVRIVELFFEIEFVKGDEVRYFNAVTKRFELLKNYVIDYTLVEDWESEKVVLINALKELVELGHLVDINNLTAESFEDKAVQDQFVKTIDAMSKSIIGQQITPQLYTDKIEPKLGHSDYEGIIDFNDPEFTPDRWASEFEKFFAAYNILQKYQYGSKNMQLVNSDAIQLMTILFGTRANKNEGITTMVKNPKLWLTRMYENKIVKVPANAMINSTSERDWDDEPYKIIDVLKQMENFTTSDGVFTYDEVYKCQDEEQLHEFLETVNNCEAVRETILPVVLNIMNESTEISEALANAGLIDEEFDSICENWNNTNTYDTNYWTIERIEAFARIIAQTNAKA